MAIVKSLIKLADVVFSIRTNKFSLVMVKAVLKLADVVFLIIEK